jgi:hypothetical protein
VYAAYSSIIVEERFVEKEKEETASGVGMD